MYLLRLNHGKSKPILVTILRQKNLFIKLFPYGGEVLCRIINYIHAFFCFIFFVLLDVLYEISVPSTDIMEQFGKKIILNFLQCEEEFPNVV